MGNRHLVLGYMLLLSAFTFAQSATKGAVKLGEVFNLKLKDSRKVGDSLTITFEGNSHKMVSADGPESPLGFAFTYLFGKKKVEDDHWEHGKAPYKWKSNGYLFTVLSCEYDNWVKMQVERTVSDK